MKSLIKQLFAILVGLCLGAILFLDDPTPEPVAQSTPNPAPSAQAPTEGPNPDAAAAASEEKSADELTTEYLRALAHIVDEPSNKPGHTTWKAIYNLQSLVELGPGAVPGIAWLLDRDYEVEYNWYAQPIDVFGISHRLLPRNIKRVRRADVLFPNQDKPNLHYGFPLSLRLGLIEVLERIGGPEAEAALLTRLRSAGKEIELAYSIKGLQVVAPDAHTPEIMTRIKEVLDQRAAVYQTDELEIAARRYLVGINDALNKALEIAKKNEGPVNEGIPYKDSDKTQANRLPVVMSSIFDTTRNLELDAPSELEYVIDRGLKFLDLEHKDIAPTEETIRTNKPSTRGKSRPVSPLLD